MQYLIVFLTFFFIKGMNSIKNNSSIPLTEIIGEEMQKYISLTRIFFCKIIECIYYNRCPEELSDFIFDEDQWFSLDIPKSPSLRELVSRRTIYGWFQLDVMISDLDMVAERWILVHEQCETTESRPIFIGKKRDIRYYTFRRFSQIMRSIYSMLNALPIQTLRFALNQISASNRRITAVCSHFRSLPIGKEDINKSSPRDNLLEIDFGPIITPLGKCTIQCTTLNDISMFIPKIINKNELSSLSFQMKPQFKKNDESSSNQLEFDDSAWFQYSLDTSSSISNSILKRSFTPDSFVGEKQEDQTDQVKMQSPEEFLDYLSNLSVEFHENVNDEKDKEAFLELKDDFEKIFKDLMEQ